MRYKPVAQIAYRAGNPAQRNAHDRPGLRQLAQQSQNRIRSAQYSLRKTAELPHNQNRAGPRSRIRRSISIPRQQVGHTRRLGGHKSQPVPPVATQEPPHRPVAKPAASIKDNQQPVADSIQFAHTCSRCLLNGQLGNSQNGVDPRLAGQTTTLRVTGERIPCVSPKVQCARFMQSNRKSRYSCGSANSNRRRVLMMSPCGMQLDPAID